MRRDGFVFVTWVGDHTPRHVHVFRDGTLVLKWDLESSCAMWGRGTRRLVALIAELDGDGLL